MSFLPSLRVSSRHLVRSSYAIPATSSFHTTAARGLKENDTNRDDLPEHYENQKNQQVKKAKEGTAKWHEGLASNSEADVKADRGDLDTESHDFKHMQEQVKKGKEAGKRA
ncbi:hypothetical protein N7456_003420 [Penicillium angulare]|uniref:Mitochondrial carrier protein PET8 n=1 Tax=Penicillium angulare TaxID=116970 RepID=A0A9W9FVD0_9EURO|nr:hypothetical protein N7456_003420 [Penicillium angulare]